MSRIDPVVTSVWIVGAAWMLFFWVFLVPVGIHAITRSETPACANYTPETNAPRMHRAIENQ